MKTFSIVLLPCSLLMALAFFAVHEHKPQDSSNHPNAVVAPAREFALRPIPFSSIHRGQQGAPHIRNRNGTSQNWGGYAVQTDLNSPQNGSVSSVQGRWTIPSVTVSSSANTYSSIWVGIDGYSNSTVEQIGTEQDWTASGQQNYVWFEMYPKAAYEVVDFPIAPGDVFSASVVYTGNGVFQLTIVNETSKISYAVPTRYTRASNAQRSSAEWIVEPPYAGGILPLADFGTVGFKNCSATVNNVTGGIKGSNWQYDPITMQTADGIVKAKVSSVTGGGSAFSVTWKHE